MNRQHFHRIMTAIDPEFLEEAQTPVKKFRVLPVIAALAACLCLAAGLIRFSRPSITPEQYGYTLSLPKNAKQVTYQATGTAPVMVEAAFTADGNAYLCRMIHTDSPTDLSGSTGPSAGAMQWQTRDLLVQFTQHTDADSLLSWYDEAKGIQWCLTGADPVALLTTAGQMVEAMGYQMAVAPEGASHVTYHALGLDGHTVGEVTFTLDGVQWSYRMAATMELEADFRDISGQEDTYSNELETQVAWCSARLSWNEDGSGKLVWFDLVPGLLYSLTMDSGASEQALMDMAAKLYEPAQGDAG